MTTTSENSGRATTVAAPFAPPPSILGEDLTEEHHEAITRSWEMPAYEPAQAPVAPQPTSHKALYTGLIAGALGLAVGAGAGYAIGTQQTTVEVVREPYPVSVPATPVLTDANGMTLGRRLAPEAQLPTGLPAPVLTDANGMTLGRRLAPIEP